MGILNLTPDSFYDGGKYSSQNQALSKAAQMLSEGADWIDVGAASSKPNSAIVELEEEWSRLSLILPQVRKEFPDVPLSIDTWRSEIARRAWEEGIDLVNDISGGRLDPKMFDFIAEKRAPYCLMHMQGNPQNMQNNPSYTNVVADQLKWFSSQIQELRARSVSDIVIDPGFGFGKSIEHNFQILKGLEAYQLLGCPILVGLSRKSMINRLLDIPASEALNGSTVLHTLALQKAASILRVHDVKEAKQAVIMCQYFNTVPDALI
jgi:dihydropteroate synthase